MRRTTTAALTAIGALLLATTSCSSGADEQAWFEDNCSTKTAKVTAVNDQGQTTEETSGEAAVQGPINPPAGLDDSSARIGMYTYDELDESMTYEEDVTSDSVFCMEPSVEDEERSKTIEAANISGDLHEDLARGDFTKLRSPEHPDGIWLNLHRSDIPEGISLSEDSTEQCGESWWLDTDRADLDNAEAADETISSHNVESLDDC